MFNLKELEIRSPMLLSLIELLQLLQISLHLCVLMVVWQTALIVHWGRPVQEVKDVWRQGTDAEMHHSLSPALSA